ncbi:MAG: tetratricopeptide repeat protein [Desulfuromonas sp.]|nr:tetratricopeptide repeat protein [Desulfuromonas sp.]
MEMGPGKILLLLFCSLHFTTISYAQDLGFADALYAEGDYYRAVTEYKRFLHENPTANQLPRVKLNIARCYLYAERWEQAEQSLELLKTSFPTTTEQDYASLLYAEIPYRQGNYSLTSQRAHGLNLSPQLLSHQQNLRLWALAQQGRYNEASNLIKQQPELSPLTPREITTLQQLPLKSPRLAGTLSAVLPGAGQLYAGRYREAGMSLALNAAFLCGGLQAIDTGNEILGGILLFFEAGWYGGNIYNAMNSTHKYNRHLQQSALQQLTEKYQFSLLLDDRSTILQLKGSLD